MTRILSTLQLEQVKCMWRLGTAETAHFSPIPVILGLLLYNGIFLKIYQISKNFKNVWLVNCYKFEHYWLRELGFITHMDDCFFPHRCLLYCSTIFKHHWRTIHISNHDVLFVNSIDLTVKMYCLQICLQKKKQKTFYTWQTFYYRTM